MDRLEEFEKDEKQLKTIKSIGERLLKIADENINEKEVPSIEILDTFKIALSIMATIN